MNKLTFAIGLVQALRTETDPPLGRYAVLLALAECNNTPLTSYAIGRRLTADHAPDSVIACAVRQGFLEMRAEAGLPTTYTLTEEGIKTVAKLINSASEILPRRSQKRQPAA